MGLNRILTGILVPVTFCLAWLAPAGSMAADGATVPTTDQAAVAIHTNYGDRLCWFHTCPGDYNQDGMVTEADITPFGVYFDVGIRQHDEAFPDYYVLSLVDGNGDGYITSADLTPIGVYYGLDVLGGYRLYASNDPADYPGSNAGPNGPGATLVASRGLSETVTDPLETTRYNGVYCQDRLRYEVEVGDPRSFEYWWIRAVDGNGNEGTPSAVWVHPGREVALSDDDQVPATWDESTSTLSWYYYNRGDYNFNSMVEVTDMHLITTHGGEVNTGDPNSLAYVIDTDGSGVVDEGDMAAVYEAWETRIFGYNVYIADTSAAYPAANDARSVLEPVAAVDFASAGFMLAETRPLLSIELPDVAAGQYLWVRPYDQLGYEGTPSNLVVVE